jgi:hypothetical protein
VTNVPQVALKIQMETTQTTDWLDIVLQLNKKLKKKPKSATASAKPG